MTDGSFHFKLCYPEEVQYYNHCNEWTQTTNPAIETSILNFRAIKLPFPFGSYGENFKGLGLSPASSDYTLIDDSPEKRNWWFAIGAKTLHNENIPGPWENVVTKVELFVKDSGI